MNVLIYIDIQNIKNISQKLKIKYLYYNLPYLFINNNINICSLYFKCNDNYYENININEIYYYMLKNTFYKKDYDNEKNIKKYDNVLLINDKIYYNELNNILEKNKNTIFLNLKTLRNRLSSEIIKFNELSYEIINYFCNTYNFHKNDFSNKNLIYDNEYLFINNINNQKVLQHYNYYKNQNKEIVELNKYVIKKRKDNVIFNNEINFNNTNLLVEDDDESSEFFKSTVSLGNYVNEIKENSFMGIMINCDKNIYNLMFIPNLINTHFINEIISYNDFIELYEKEIEDYKITYNKKIKNKNININNINSENIPVNAIIPLYINKIHCKQIFNIFEVHMGKIFFGSSEHFDNKLYRIYYKILIDYVYKIYDDLKNSSINDKNCLLFLNYLRFCCEITKKLRYHKGIEKYIDSLDNKYLNNKNALEYLLGLTMTTGNINYLNKCLDYYKKLEDNNVISNEISLVLKITLNIIKEFKSWKHFLDIFEINNGFFIKLDFIKNIDI